MKSAISRSIGDSVSDLIRYKARALVGHYGFTSSDREDVEQDLVLHLIEHFDRIELVRIHKAVLHRVLDHKIISIVRHRLARVRDKRRDASLDAVVKQHACDGFEILDDRFADPETRSDLEMDLQEAIEMLDGDARHVCELLKHQSIVATAQRLGLTRGKTRAHVSKIRALLTSAGLDVYSRD